MRNKDLYDALKEYCEAVLRILDAILKSGEVKIPTSLIRKFQIVESGKYSYSYISMIHWIPLINWNKQDLTQQASYQIALRAMENDPKIASHLDKRVNASIGPIPVSGEQILLSLVALFLQRKQNTTFDENEFNIIYDEIESYFYLDRLSYRGIAPLHNFEMESEKIDLDNNLSIIRLSNEERGRLLTQSTPSEHLAIPFPDYPCAIEIYLNFPKIIGDTNQQVMVNDPNDITRQKFDEVISTLRLFKSDLVSYKDFEVKSTSWEPLFGMALHPAPSTLPHVGFGSSYTLLKAEVEEFLEFWRRYEKARRIKQQRKEIDIALRRLNYSYARERREDKLVDFMIGLEALLVQQLDELRYRLSMRGAALLGKSPIEREQIFAELYEAYGLRGKIVHGSEPKAVKIMDKTVQFNELVERIEDHLRSAIKEFVWRCATRSEQQVRDALDRELVRGFEP